MCICLLKRSRCVRALMAPMASYYDDNDDLRWYVTRGIEWGPLIALTERGFVDDEGPSDAAEALELYEDVLKMAGQFVADSIAPHAAAIDAKGVSLVDGEVVFPPELDQIFAQIRELGLHGLTVPRELGGMNAPLLVYFLMAEMMARADVSVMAHHGFHGGMAMAALVFSLREGTTTIDPRTGRIVETRFAEVIQEIVAGDAWGCMDITEPDAGSDMAALRATAACDKDGRWFVSGEKIFITSGHGKYHFVVARTEPLGDDDGAFDGLKGLSFFLVPTYHQVDGVRTRVVPITRLEEKLGHHGSATCGLLFDRTPAHLLGKRGEGFRYMLTLMNNARVGVGFECIGLCEAAYRKARDYAAQRESMGKTIDQHEMIADFLDEMESDIVGIRALAVTAAVNEEMAQKLRLALEHETAEEAPVRPSLSAMKVELRRRQRLSRRLTPLLKYLAAEKAVEMARRCVQIHGGNGYMREFGAEKLLRDAIVMPIYEGTSQIQSLMAMKDTLGAVMKNPRRFVAKAAQARWRSVSSRDPVERRVARLQLLCFNVQQQLLLRTAGDKLKGLGGQPVTQWPERFLKQWDPKRDFGFAMLHAERLTRILADVAIAELLLRQTREHAERRPLLERHLERAEVRCAGLEREIVTTGDRLLRKLAGVSHPRADAAE